MKYLRNLFILAAAILGLTASGVQAQGFSGGRTIERQIFKRIIKLPYYGVFDNIAFQVQGDTVTLMGKVTQPTTRRSAERVVEKIAGVENVVNNIEVLPLSSFDDSIRLQTLRTLQNGGSLYRYFLSANSPVKIIVDRGNVTLEGFIDNRGDYNLANILVRSVPGVFSVTNNLIIEKELVR
ncbi:MAG: BON domain-containing protein [Pyrinomonadaceae bacterium]|nr:BON domain-containing protein [Pyrinomonadaceae bacterium]